MNFQVEFLTIAFQGNTCAKNRLNLREIVATALNNAEADKSSNSEDEVSAEEAIEIIFTDSQLNVVIDELSKHLPWENVQRARRIFRGFQRNATPEELEGGSVGSEADDSDHE